MKTMLLLMRDDKGRVEHVAIGSALLEADWREEVSTLMAVGEAPTLSEFFSYTPRAARRAYEELCALGDVEPNAEEFRQEWFPAATGVQATRWLRDSANTPRSRLRRLLGPECLEEVNTMHAALAMAERSGRGFHLVEVEEGESRRFAGREIIVGPENNQMQRTAPTRTKERRR